jgi:hypothetical protein
MDVAKQATLDYLVNPALVSKVQNRKTADLLLKKDMKPYKSRITKITQSYLSGAELDGALGPEFSRYAKACIAFFELEDKKRTAIDSGLKAAREPGVMRIPRQGEATMDRFVVARKNVKRVTNEEYLLNSYVRAPGDSARQRRKTGRGAEKTHPAPQTKEG